MRLKTGKLDSDVLQSAVLDKIVYKKQIGRAHV